MEKNQIMYFKIFKNTKGEYYWTLKAGNHETICWSEGYINYDDAVHSMNLVKRNASTAPLA